MPDSASTIFRVNHRGRAAEKLVLAADNTSIRAAPDGSLVLELFRYGRDQAPIESYRFHLCAEDRARIRRVA